MRRKRTPRIETKPGCNTALQDRGPVRKRKSEETDYAAQVLRRQAIGDLTGEMFMHAGIAGLTQCHGTSLLRNPIAIPALPFHGPYLPSPPLPYILSPSSITPDEPRLSTLSDLGTCQDMITLVITRSWGIVRDCRSRSAYATTRAALPFFAAISHVPLGSSIFAIPDNFYLGSFMLIFKLNY
ncbi:hypothetical protein GGR53DRAFT_3304 [Hypoxylon sp. FL1150]|nr:hypothetical protein GGR53DRAFT_3304 [Hypoxylon sp. FL1150]